MGCAVRVRALENSCGGLLHPIEPLVRQGAAQPVEAEDDPELP
jgi:hypothetical protein